MSGWEDALDATMSGVEEVLAALLRDLARLPGCPRRRPRGRPVARERARAEARAQDEVPPPRRYAFQSPFGHRPPPAKPPGKVGAPFGNRNAVTHGRRTQAARAERAALKQALLATRAHRRRLVQLSFTVERLMQERLKANFLENALAALRAKQKPAVASTRMPAKPPLLPPARPRVYRLKGGNPALLLGRKRALNLGFNPAFSVPNLGSVRPETTDRLSNVLQFLR